MREEKKCEWNEWTIIVAARQGNLEMVKYCVANQCPINERACEYAAENGHLEVLKYLREEAKASWNWLTASWAAQNGHLHTLEYLVAVKMNGHLDCLKYLHETAKAPLTSTPYKERTSTTTSNVYNTSSTTTAHYQTVGDTNMENCTRPYHHHHQNKTCNIRKRENARQKLFTLSIKILQYLFLHKFVAQEEDLFITSRTEERDKERERKSKSLVLVSLLPFRVLSSCFLLPLPLGERSEYSGKINWIFVR